MSISKSRYTLFRKCEKAFWLNIFKPEEAAPIDPAQQARFDQGTEVGNVAKKLFDGGIDVTTKNGDDLDLTAMIAKTKEAMRKGVSPIYEASFSHDGNYCAVDILRKTENGWAIYEVKSTSYPKSDGKPAKLDKYAPDVAYQKWLLEQCGVNVTNVYLVCLNSEYVRHGDLDIKKLFHIEEFDKYIEEEYAMVPECVIKAKEVYDSPSEPLKDLGKYCSKPYACPFWQYCKQQKGLPEPSVFDVYGGAVSSTKENQFYIDQKLENYYAGRVSFDDLKGRPLGRVQRLQVEGKEFVDKDGIRAFLKPLTGALYFLDFETMAFSIPQFDGTKPYQQVTFQYSLHIMDDKSGAIEHREFLAPSDGSNPLRAVAEQLCKDIPENVCVLAYNKKFECSRIKEMADMFDDLKSHLLNIRKNIKDLLDPFQAGYYYLPAMGGSFSIKSVLPALFPDNPELDYHNLEGSVHNGGEAMTIFPKIKDMSPSDAAAARKSLLEYCWLDTWAMVKVLEALKDKIGEGDIKNEIMVENNHKEAKIMKTTPPEQNRPNLNTNLVIVDYTDPYESFGWRGSIHIEIDLNNNTLSSAGWRNGSIPLSTVEEQKYLKFFSDINNLNAFFDDRKAYSTPVDSRFVHFKYYDLKIQWNGRSKSIRVGHPDIPFEHPFTMY